MPNVVLTKHDGKLASIPAGSITAIFSLALDTKAPEHINANSLVMTSFRGEAHSYFMADTGRDVFRALEIALDGKKALRLSRKGPLPVALASGEDMTYLQEGAALSWEEVDVGEQPRYRATIRRFDGQVSDVDVSHTPENLAALNAATDTKDIPNG